MKKTVYFILALLLPLFSCSEEKPLLTPDTRPLWLVPQEEVLDSGVGRDGIPSINDPKFDDIKDVNEAFDDQLVIGLEHEGIIHGYPIPIMDWHEIVNDKLNDLHVAVTYCPLTGTAIGWNRKFGSTVTTFGVSGLLYNTNLMPYDRRTLSIWSQQQLECVNGTRIGQIPETYSLIETSLSTWKKSFPEARIMNANTGFDRVYSFYPYGGYRTNNDQLFFPVSNTDSRIPNKERVLGVIINNSSKAYRFNEIGGGTDIIHDFLDGQPIIVVRSGDDNYNTAFLNMKENQYFSIQDSLPYVMKDNRENYYDLAGRILTGPDQGTILEKPQSFIGYWFSWPAFYPDITIYEE